MTEIQFVCTITGGPIGSSIAFQTRFDGVHTLILDADSRDKQIVEALAHVPGDPWYQTGRVTIRSLSDYDPDTECYWYKPKSDEFNHRAAWGFAVSKVGAPYDYLGCLRFVTRRSHAVEDVERWFCSELATVVSRVGGGQVQYLPAWAVSPKLHCCSTDHTTPKRMRIGEVLDA